MRCASAGTWTVSGLTPAALCAGRVGGPGSAAAGSRAHDSSGRRSFPSTPAPAIWVVGVITERVGDGALPPGGPDRHPLQVTTVMAATEAVAVMSSRVGRLPPNSTRLTLTSGQLALVRVNDRQTRVSQLRQFVGPALPPA